MDQKVYVEWVRRGLDKPGKTRTGLAKALGLEHPQGSRIAAGKRQIKAHELQPIAEYLDEPIPEDDRRIVMNGHPRARGMSGPRIPVKGAVRAGMWLPVDETWDAGDKSLLMTPLPAYPSEAQYALEVMGDSMNQTPLLDGEYAICVDIAALGRTARHGELVVVERNRGGLREVTIKRVFQISQSRIELRPESDNPAHQPFVLDNGDPSQEHTEITVKAIVVAAYRDKL